MPRPVGYGRPGTNVIPAGWAANAARVVENTLDCAVSIAPAGMTPQWVEEDKKTRSLPAPSVYVGRATVTPIAEDADQVVDAQDQVPIRRYEVKLEHASTGVRVDHVITINASPDVSLTGRRLTVTGVEKASRRFSRILTAVDAD